MPAEAQETHLHKDVAQRNVEAVVWAEVSCGRLAGEKAWPLHVAALHCCVDSGEGSGQGCGCSGRRPRLKH